MTTRQKGRAAGQGSSPASRANLKPAEKGEARHTKLHSAAAKDKIGASLRRAARVRREADEHANLPEVRKRLFQSAEDRVYRDAMQTLRENEPLAAERIVAIIREGSDRDALSAAAELLDRTRGKPVQGVLTASVGPGVMLPEQARELLLARLKPRRSLI